MISKYVAFTVKPEELQPILTAIKAFLIDIEASEPETVYEAYRITDQFSFLHVMHFADEAAADRHSKAEYTNRFVDTLYPRCTEEPKFVDIERV
jgi:quinol monooxygenase YgiN